MTTAQLNGMRGMWDACESVVKNRKTAREMALTPHNLAKHDSRMATTDDGHVWVWDDRFQHWALWK